jgi:NADPH-dependent stearoyl-CoA 9-desaturase
MAITDIAAYAHLTAADITSLERELEKIRRDVEDCRRASNAAHDEAETCRNLST